MYCRRHLAATESLAHLDKDTKLLREIVDFVFERTK